MMGATTREAYFSDARQYSLDAKLRLTLPPDFRRQMDGTVLLVALFDSIYCFTPEGHRRWADSLFENNSQNTSEKSRNLHLFIYSHTKTVDIDSAGRISLTKIDPADLERLGIKKEVQVVGDRDHFEIWDAEAWKQQQEGIGLDDLRASMFSN